MFGRAGQRGIVKAFRLEVSTGKNEEEAEGGGNIIDSEYDRHRRLPFLFLMQMSEAFHSDIQLGGLGVHKAVLATHSDAFQVCERRKTHC